MNKKIEDAINEVKAAAKVYHGLYEELVATQTRVDELGPLVTTSHETLRLAEGKLRGAIYEETQNG